ncbi:uncharacterized protein LOC131665192 [Phymastichus coffea]|uniref:uncharacterized protein LOC131665192 n=1 Tax=Phymastichus coffea TaxID=108790 RepID=UPI00273CA72B|nr:uncharacterized protein LOC131665192 [Phymastichus coffea]
MVGRAFSVKVDLDLHAVTCPGVWLCPSGKVALKISIFNSCVSTHRLTPIFPLLYHNKFTFKKIFIGVTTLVELEKKLSTEYIFAELIQWSSTANRNVTLAVFETNLVELLYPVPCYKGLLAGVDVDLLMEPAKCFPGILSPKIEVSTRTTIEEVIDFDICPTKARLINPKNITTLNQPCSHKKKDLLASKPVIRQKKVCHSRQRKSNSYICRSCRRRPNNVEVLHNCDCSDKHTLLHRDNCYLSKSHKKSTCECSSVASRKSCENFSICNDAHIFDSCPICLKYKCYFPSHKSESNNLEKCYDRKKYLSLDSECSDNRTKLLYNKDSNIHDDYKHKVSRLSSAINSIDLKNNKKMDCASEQVQTEEKSSKHSCLEKLNSDLICKSTSAPSLKDDPTTSILRAKMKQLERTKERLNYARCKERELDHISSCNNLHNSQTRRGFYKNLGKFYKRMYKQAKQRAYDLDEL